MCEKNVLTGIKKCTIGLFFEGVQAVTNFYPFIYGLGSLSILLNSTNLIIRIREFFCWILLDFSRFLFLFSSVHSTEDVDILFSLTQLLYCIQY